MGIPEDLDDGVRALLSGDLDLAQARFVHVLSQDPANPLADSGLKNVVQERLLRHLNLPALPEAKKIPGGVPDFLAALGPYRKFEISRTRLVRLAVPLASLMNAGLTPTDAFVLSRLAGGKLLLDDIVGLVGKPEEEILPILERFLERGLIAIG